MPGIFQLCDTPQKAADSWSLHVATNLYFKSECECFTVLLLDTRRRAKAHQIVSFGTLASGGRVPPWTRQGWPPCTGHRFFLA